MQEASPARTPVTYAHCDHVRGPFFHGTRSHLAAGTELVPGFGSNFHQGRVSNHIYFSALVETAVWGAELATALDGTADAADSTAHAADSTAEASTSSAEASTSSAGRGHVYVVEPLGPFEDDPNVTDKRFPGNPTQSYRTRDALRVVRELEDWQGHPPEVLAQMLDHLALLREQGLDVIED